MKLLRSNQRGGTKDRKSRTERLGYERKTEYDS